MNIGRVKNLVIVFFVILNITLLALNWDRENRYKITSEQEAAIVKVLMQNNIGLYTYIVKDFHPLRQIEMTAYVYDSLKMIRVLFDGLPTRTPESGKTTWELDGKTLIIYNKDRNGFLFENPQGTGKIELSKESAQEVCDKLLEKLDDKSLNLKLDYISNEKDGYYILEYRSVFNQNTIYSSTARFKVTKNGIVQFRGTYFQSERFTDNTREIYSADEALYSLMQELRNVYENTGELIQINHMDVVYRAEDNNADVKTILKADPYYRVYISARPDQPYLINAYTNVVVK